MKVELVAYSVPVIGGDPRCIPVLAAKVSQGKVLEKGWEHYLTNYSRENVSRWLIEAADRFPSILEHVTFTFLIEDVTRICSHQLVRHRIASYTQESQRYSEYRIVKCLECLTSAYANGVLCIERSSNIDEIVDDLLNGDVWKTWSAALEKIDYDYEYEDYVECLSVAFDVEKCDPLTALRSLKSYAELRARGMPPEEARYVLPQCSKTSLLVTMNLRELLHVACLRLSPRAQSEIREVVKSMIDEVRKVVPEIDDMIKVACRR